jgi:hypothetical protein
MNGLVDLFNFKDYGIPFESFAKFQIIQKAEGKFCIKAVLDKKDKWESEQTVIRKKIHKILDSDVKVEFEAVDDIPPAASGKHLYFINEI